MRMRSRARDLSHIGHAQDYARGRELLDVENGPKALIEKKWGTTHEKFRYKTK